MKPTIAFVYKWTHLPTGKWYIGSRTKNGCHTEDGYICSSRVIKPMITENQSEWVRTIICIGHPIDMLELEARYLSLLDAKHDPMSYNQHNGDGKFCTTGIPAHNKGKPGPKGRIPWNKGKKCPEISAGRQGQPANNKGKASPRRGLENPWVSEARKSLLKDVTRIFDRKPMSMVYYMQWIDKIENPEKWAAINKQRSEKMKGRESHRKGKKVGPYKKKTV